MLRLQRELGEQGRNLSEIDVSDPDDVTIMEPRDGHVLKLLLGIAIMRCGYRNFVTHYAEIVERFAGCGDARSAVRGRITVVE